MDLFSSRRRAVTPELTRLISQYERLWGHPPNKRTIWLLGQQAAQNTRRPKSQSRKRVGGEDGDDDADEDARLKGWERQVAATEVRSLTATSGQARGYAAGHPMAGITEEERQKAARVAVAEVQRHHAAWTMFELRLEVRRALPAGADEETVWQVADRAVRGYGGTEVMRIAPAPGPVDASALGTRRDGTSIYRPPNEDLFVTVEHLNLEETVLNLARSAVTPLAAKEQAEVALSMSDLSDEQREAAVRMLTGTTMVTVLSAAAGAGKTHVVAEFAKAVGTLTGARVIGLATAENAARVMADEARRQGAVMEAYNTAAFLGKVEGSGELRHPVPLCEGDVLVLDESSMLSTSDLALVAQAAHRAGARIIAAGDMRQLGPVEAGGMFRAIAAELGAAELHEVRRFRAVWERDASLRLRNAERDVIAVYDAHGRIRGADREKTFREAVGMWLADHLAGKDTLLLAGSNAEAADLARAAQAQLIAAGQVTRPHAWLADGNQAGTGDVIRARLNTRIDAGGDTLANRDVLRIDGFVGTVVKVCRKLPEGGWSRPFTVDTGYLSAHAELGYAGNVHVAQGKTVDTAHLLVTGSLSRQSLYVGMTRGRDANTAHVITGETSRHPQKEFEQESAQAVFADILERDAEELSATEQVRLAQERVAGTGHLLTLWKEATRVAGAELSALLLRDHLAPAHYTRIHREHQCWPLMAALRQARLGGHDVRQLVHDITAAPLDGARSVSAVLHARLRAAVPQTSTGITAWTTRTPENAPEVAHAAAAALDQRAAELGARLAVKPEPWLARQLGILAPTASVLLREDYTRRAGIAAAYREAAGITNPEIAVSLTGHNGNPELEQLRRDAVRELQIPDEQALVRAASRGDLEARVIRGERAQAQAPEAAPELRHVAHAEQEAVMDSADPHASSEAREQAAALVGTLARERAGLEALRTTYDEWVTRSRTDREAAELAQAELDRRGGRNSDHTEPEADEHQAGDEYEPHPEAQAEAEADTEAEMV
jgi:hypothetical protein